MVDFDNFYTFAADHVEYIAVETDDSNSYPFVLRVYLKSGSQLSVRYKTEAARDTAKKIIVNRISTELNAHQDQIYNRLYLIHDTVKRLDKRQLRIWQQLKTLLRLPAGEEGQSE